MFTGMPLVKRQAFKFSEKDVAPMTKSSLDDCIEVRVHRIENRQRVPVQSSFNTGTSAFEDSQVGGFW